MDRSQPKHDPASGAPAPAGDLLGAVHDANQLLSVILGRTMQLLEEEALAPAQRLRLEAIARAAGEAGDLLGGVMRQGPTDFQAAQGSLARSDLARIAEQSWDAAQAYLQATGGDTTTYSCRLDLADELIVAAPEPSVRQVVGNLLINALQAMPTGGRISVVGRHDGPRVSLSVVDEGPGMAPETLARLFELGFSEGKKGGHGIGLYHARRIATALGGDLSAASVPGEGATFVLSLPAAAGAVATEAAVSATATAAPLEMLVVDDEAAVRELLTDVLEAEGHRPTVCASAENARDHFVAGAYDLVLLDYGLPGLSGLELARVFRVQDPEVVLALVTGWGNETVAEATETGLIDLWETKPLDLNKIRHLASAAHQLQRERRARTEKE